MRVHVASCGTDTRKKEILNLIISVKFHVSKMIFLHSFQ